MKRTSLFIISSIVLFCILFFLGVVVYERIKKESGEVEKSTKMIIVKQLGGMVALSMECEDKNYISNAADWIIEGVVEKVESKWNEEKTSIFTYTNLLIENYVKGTPFESNKLQIITPGGTVGEISQWVEDQPIFHQGNRVRIYLEETNGEFSIVCAYFGIEEI